MAEKDKSNNLNQEDLKILVNKIIEGTKNADFDTLFSPVDEEDLKNINGFIFAADEDLKTSKILYENKLYSNSIYHLQQAIEKMIKAQALKFFPLEYKSITKTSHNSPEIYLRLLKISAIESILKDISKTFPQIDVKMLDIVNKSIDELKKDKLKLKIANFPFTKINALLTICSTFMELYGNIDTPNKLKAFYDDDFEQLISDIEKEFELDYNNVKDILDDAIMVLLINPIKLILIIPSLYILGIIVYPHEAFTRYPGKSMRPENYNLDLGIVQTYPKIYEMSEIILKRLRD